MSRAVYDNHPYLNSGNNKSQTKIDECSNYSYESDEDYNSNSKNSTNRYCDDEESANSLNDNLFGSHMNTVGQTYNRISSKVVCNPKAEMKSSKSNKKISSTASIDKEDDNIMSMPTRSETKDDTESVEENEHLQEVEEYIEKLLENENFRYLLKKQVEKHFLDYGKMPSIGRSTVSDESNLLGRKRERSAESSFIENMPRSRGNNDFSINKVLIN
jgi:hypothetical protein